MSSPFRKPDKIILSGCLHGGDASEKISFQLDLFAYIRRTGAERSYWHLYWAWDVLAPCYLCQLQLVWSRSTEETFKQRVGSCAWIVDTNHRNQDEGDSARQGNVGESCHQLQLLTGTKYKSGTAYDSECSRET